MWSERITRRSLAHSLRLKERNSIPMRLSRFVSRTARLRVTRRTARRFRRSPRLADCTLAPIQFKHQFPYNLPPRWMEKKKDVDPEHAVQLRVDQRHHRRKLRFADDQSERRTGWFDLRWQHSIAGRRLHVRWISESSNLGGFARNVGDLEEDLQRKRNRRGTNCQLDTRTQQISRSRQRPAPAFLRLLLCFF